MFSFIKNWGVRKERGYFAENLAMLLTAGMGILEALEAINTELHSSIMKRRVKKVKDAVSDGSPLWESLKGANIFPAHIIGLIKIGEQSGTLSQSLQVGSEQIQKDESFRSKIRSAMMYPMLVLTVTVVVGVGVAWFVLPRLTVVFSQLDVELPVMTRALIAVGDFLNANGAIAVPLFLVILAVTFYFIFISPATKFVGQRMLFSFRPTKNLIREVQIARFGYNLGSLLDAGLPILEALDALADSTTYKMYEKLFRHMRTEIEEGNSFQESLKSYSKSQDLLTAPVQQLIATAEQSGNLSGTLLKVSANYEAKIDDTTKNLSVVLEPIMLVIVWLAVLAVAVAVILPIYDLIGGINP